MDSYGNPGSSWTNEDDYHHYYFPVVTNPPINNYHVISNNAPNSNFTQVSRQEVNSSSASLNYTVVYAPNYSVTSNVPISEDIKYVDNNEKNVSPDKNATITFVTVTNPVTNEKITYYKSGKQADPDLDDDGKPDNSWSEGKKSTFSLVKNPSILGYHVINTTDPNGNGDLTQTTAKEVHSNDKDLNVTVTYAPNTETANVTYIDDTTGKTLSAKHLTGDYGSTDPYRTSDTIADYEKQGYQLFSDNYPTNGVVYKQDGTAQSFEVHLTHETTPVGPNNPQTPGTPINPDNPDGPKWPTGTDQSSLTQTITRTVNYYDKQTKAVVAKQVTEQVTYNRTAIVDKVTGQIIGYSTTGGNTVDQTDGSKAWIAKGGDTNWAAVTSPDLSSEGYTAPDLATVEQTAVNPGDKDATVNVYYDHVVVPVNPSKPETPGTPGTPINPDKPDGPKWPTSTNYDKTVNETISYVDQNGHVVAKQHTDSVNFTRTVVVDNVTGEVITSGAGTTAWKATNGDTTFDAVLSPVVPGYVADKAQTAAVTDLNADSADVNETVTYTKVGSLVPSSSDGKFPKTPKVVYPNDPRDATKVTPAGVPTVPGYTEHDPEGHVLTTGSSYQPGDPTKDTTITYTADTQKGSVSYVDDTTGKTLKTDSISGTTGSKSSYSTSGSIADYKKQGYELVTDGYPADLTFDNDDTTDQNFTVHLKHQNIQSTEAKTVKETIHYQGAGNQTPADNTAQVSFTRQVSTDAVTGEKTYGSWSADQSFAAVTSPKLKGYTADKAQIDKQTVNGDSKDLEFTVTYTKNAPTITTEKKTINETIHYQGAGNQTPADHTASVDFTRQVSTDAVTGEKTYGPWSAAQSFDAVTSPELKGYTADKAQIDKQTVNGDSKDLEFTVTYTKNAPTITTEKKTVNETIHYQGAGNQTPADHTAFVDFTRQVSTDAVTGEKTYGSWSADQSFAAVTSPVIKGYTPDQAEIGAQTVSGDASDLDFTVIYTKDAPTKPVNLSQPTTPAKPVNPSQPATPTKPVNPSQPATPTKPVQAGQAAATNFVDQRLPQTDEADQQHMTLSGLLLLAMSSLLGLFGMTKRQRKE
ncbi:mucin-binding protein [Lactobacillus delbrueckii]|uniref:mucin-binding protein n=1 Tax=Lactobacillus delbrueckii TaxID=1584 RepID=UPI001E4AA824|nr:LPXTG cell wall anchor domain-containing protein [Lactobacillus delbrueckii]MCD5487265.1 LPXTG cell wall anchor domain-containing protein [Lactobacillus delbrueckii subsp. lactis]